MSVAHELGHLILDIADELGKEKAAYCFAGAFLAPKPAVLLELEDRLSRLDPYELSVRKHIYGMSMQAWIYRARDLHILSKVDATAMHRQFNVEGWEQLEPGDPYPVESTERLELK